MRMIVRLAATVGALTVLCSAIPRAAVLPPMRLVRYASGFTHPVGIVQDPTDARVQFVVEQGGRIRTVVDGVVQTSDFLDLRGSIVSGGEQGLLGLAFPPDAATSRRFYVNFTSSAPRGATVVARFTRFANPRVADAGSRLDLRWSADPALGRLQFIPQPFANHNGGCLQFGADGYLYIAMGDGGAADDPNNNAQNLRGLLGKILRVDVSGNSPDGFVIPSTNPFVNDGVSRPEIWALGLRNPWRFSVDDVARGGTGALVIGDVGQNQFEEVDYEPRARGGRNYGWRNREGLHDHVPPALAGSIDPIHEYDHSIGASITGGYIYRGASLAELRGRYVFADFVTGRIWSMAVTPNATTGEALASDLVEHTASLGVPAFNVSSFGVDSAGELFVVDYGGSVYRLVRAVPRPPTKLRIIR